MTITNGKIVEATEKELFSYYLTRGFDDLMSFPDFLDRMKHGGCTIIGEQDE